MALPERVLLRGTGLTSPARDHEPDDDTSILLDQARCGSQHAFEELFDRHREYLRMVVGLRMSSELQARVDVSDVIQETHIEAFKRLDDYLRRNPMPFKLWLRMTARQCLVDLSRRHLDAQARSVYRENALPADSSVVLARQLMSGSTPSQRVAREEIAAKVRTAITALSDSDREILLLRNYEGLTSQEAGHVLEIDPDAARKRHTRALMRLRDVLKADGFSDSQVSSS